MPPTCSLVLNVMADASSVAQLREELAFHGLDAESCPADDLLQVMLDVESGDVRAAARSILDAQAAERRVERANPPASPALPAPTHSWVTWCARAMLWPFSFLGAALLWCFRLVQRFSPQRPGTDTRGLTRYAQDPKACALRWIHELELETNGSVLPDAASFQRVPLPPFVTMSYSEALRQSKNDIRILMIVLTSRVHNEHDFFCKHVLTDPHLVRMLHSPDLLVWGGDISDREAYRVSALLEATTFPFVAFIALQPRRSRSRGRIVPHPTVLSRLEGSPQTILSASSICAHISDVLLPRTSAYLHELRSERRLREMDRELREEQNLAFEHACLRDQERVIRKRAENERKIENESQRALEEHKHALLEAQKAQWRAWARAYLVPREPDLSVTPVIRVNVKMPDGRNLQRRFFPSDSLEQLYAYVDTLDVHNDDAPVSMPRDYAHSYDFYLVQTYPRRVLSPENMATLLQDVDGLGPSANLIVESSMAHNLDEDDEDDDDNDD